MGQIQTKQHVRREPELFQRKHATEPCNLPGLPAMNIKCKCICASGSMALEEEWQEARLRAEPALSSQCPLIAISSPCWANCPTPRDHTLQVPHSLPAWCRAGWRSFPWPWNPMGTWESHLWGTHSQFKHNCLIRLFDVANRSGWKLPTHISHRSITTLAVHHIGVR